MLNAQNGCLSLPSGTTDYIRFGGGSRSMVLLPGLSDGLTTVKGMALPFALLYRSLAKDFTVYMFSRRRELAPHTGTREMAEDLNAAMEALGLSGAAVVGVSQGGMIAQWLAIEYPDKVERLVLTVTLCRPNDTAREVIARWSEMARRGDYKRLMLDTAERSYSSKRVRRQKLGLGLMGNLGRPKSFDRFLIQAESCVTHDSAAELGRISCPTLVIGGTEDQIVTGSASEELAAGIPDSRLYLYEGLGHGLYEEAPDFWGRVASFCR